MDTDAAKECIESADRERRRRRRQCGDKSHGGTCGTEPRSDERTREGAVRLCETFLRSEQQKRG